MFVQSDGESSDDGRKRSTTRISSPGRSSRPKRCARRRGRLEPAARLGESCRGDRGFGQVASSRCGASIVRIIQHPDLGQTRALALPVELALANGWRASIRRSEARDRATCWRTARASGAKSSADREGATAGRRSSRSSIWRSTANSTSCDPPTLDRRCGPITGSRSSAIGSPEPEPPRSAANRP